MTSDQAATKSVVVDLGTLLRLLEVEEKRLQSLRTRASGLAGFAGIVVALAAAFVSALAPSLGTTRSSELGLSAPFRWIGVVTCSGPAVDA